MVCMSACDMCGKETKEVYIIRLEDTTLEVCKACSNFGDILEKKEPEKQKPKKEFSAKKRESVEEEIVSNYAEVVRGGIKKKGVEAKELAKKLCEKEKLINRIISGSRKPDLTLARKLEKALQIRLIEKVEEKSDDKYKSQGREENLTIGDIVKVVKR